MTSQTLKTEINIYLALLHTQSYPAKKPYKVKCIGICISKIGTVASLYKNSKLEREQARADCDCSL